MPMTLTLYSTQACQLCDRALELLGSMPELGHVELDVVDIALDDELLSRYERQIPVLRGPQGEIAWPFNADDVLAILGP
jgi:glutaredoxin